MRFLVGVLGVGTKVSFTLFLDFLPSVNSVSGSSSRLFFSLKLLLPSSDLYLLIIFLLNFQTFSFHTNYLGQHYYWRLDTFPSMCHLQFSCHITVFLPNLNLNSTIFFFLPPISSNFPSFLLLGLYLF